MNKSESISSLAAALCKAQSEFPTIAKSKEVTVKSDKGSYKFAYAPLEAITSAIRPVLSACGLAFVQSASGDSLTTTLLHTSGEWLQSDPTPIKVSGGTAQALGSGITYARRYSLVCALGLVVDEDDDGNSADGNQADIVDVDKQIAMLANFIVARHKEGNDYAAFEAWHCRKLDDTEKSAKVWELLKPYSKLRSYIKEQVDLANDDQRKAA